MREVLAGHRHRPRARLTHWKELSGGPRARSLFCLFALSGLGCGEETVDPLDCQFENYLFSTSAEALEPIAVHFVAEWGKAPTRMKVRVLDADQETLAILACGRDEQKREWELQATWLHLPFTPAYPLQIQFFANEPLRQNAPDFAGSLSECSTYGCTSVDHSAFTRKGTSNVAGSSRIENYDPVSGRLVGNVLADPGEPRDQPPTRLELNISWDPSRTSRRLDAGEDAETGDSDAGAQER